MKLIRAGLLGLAVWGIGVSVATAQPVQLGASTYFLSPKGGDPGMPPATYRTDALKSTAGQTSQWYSSLVFSDTPEVIYAQPLTVKPTAAGLEMALPSQVIVPTWRKDVEVHFPHTDPLVMSPAAFTAGRAKLAKATDWSIDISMSNGNDQFVATVAHGSPYVYARLSRGDLRVTLPAQGQRTETTDARVLALQVKGKGYALFGPTGVKWEQTDATTWVARLPDGKGYVSAAALPDNQPATLELLTKHAYAYLTDTRVSWNYDQAKSEVETTFKATAQVMEGADNGVLLGLYPHHWLNNSHVAGKLGPAYQTIRGKLHLLAANEFKKTNPHVGFVPMWPAVTGSEQQAQLADVMKSDKRNARRMMLQNGEGPYWQGKGLLRTLKLVDVAEQQGDADGAKQLLEMTKKRMEEWFAGESRKSYFHYDKSLGAVSAYPNEFFVAEQINDHHFTYGYWIRAAAEIALRDPDWAKKDKWGGMVDLLVADIATAERGRADFPFLRNFDPYEGHSWASGIGLGEFGNNQESSSEAINAWVGLMLWGEVTGDRALRDLGAYLYAAELEAINFYWFDIHKQVFPPEYKNVETSMVFGGKYAHNTWWTDEPRQIKGINLLPITTASTYLATDPEFVKRNLAALVPEMETYDKFGKRPNNPPPRDIWQDIFAKYTALVDPAQALKEWDRWGSVEVGDSRTHTLHFMLSLQQMGVPDLSVKANTLMYAVFKQANGTKTYLAYNPGSAPLQVTFSDGKQLSVAPKTLARGQ